MYKLSPSDFAYLYEECKLCYCLKIKDGIFRPKSLMPGIFTAINSIVQGSLVGKNLKTLSPDLPDGEIIKQEGWVESMPVMGTNVYIFGKYDLLVKNADGTHTLIDLKLSKPDGEKQEKYKTQLGAYKFALEHPAKDAPIKISKLALLVFYPESVEFTKGVAKLAFPPKWMEIPIDDAGFINFAQKISDLLCGPLPKEDSGCAWCQYRHMGETLTHRAEPGSPQELPF